ncbi:Dak phosphatase [Hortaea werneckii]|nr:Dak phosphatase [Hortaea werneckii]
MAVAVEQTIPFPQASLDLQNAQRWNSLFPLIRPTVQTIQTAKGQKIMVDKALAQGKHIHIAAIGGLGNFSSKILDNRTATAIITDQSGAGLLTPADIEKALQNAGAAKEQGVVIVRLGKKRRVETHSPSIIEVETEGELEQDHVLHLLANATESARSSMTQAGELLKLWAKSNSTSRSKFHVEKANGNPAVLHAEGPTGYQNAKDAITKDLKQAMKAHSAQEGPVTYSVHYSDTHKTSKFNLSHSTVLNHTDTARGFGISICPIDAHYLAPQAKPQADTRATGQGESALHALMPKSSTMTFTDAEVRKRITAGCNAVIKAEPTITEYDTIVGDGDCGYTLRDGAKQVLSFIEGKDLSKLPQQVAQLVSELEVNMGGTSGALYCIYLTALAGALASDSSVPKALKTALDSLCKYTKARLGDRTMMDALIPFIETLNSTNDGDQAIEKSKQGVEGTKQMQASLGRSTYLDESATQGVPDPGAFGLLILLQGMTTA